MRYAVTPLSRLFAVPHSENTTVATGAGRRHDWNEFARDVGALTTRLKKAGVRRWLVADADAYAFAVGVFATLHADCQAVLPANLQRGHLVDLAATTDGVISSEEHLPDATNTFETTAYADLSVLQPLDAEIAEIILHTSGTTGAPVAATKPLRCLEAEIAALTQSFAPLSSGTVLATVPPYHIYGLLFRILWPLATERPFSTDLISYPEELESAVKNNSGCMLVSSPVFLKRALPVLDLNHLKKYLGLIFSSGGMLPPPIATAYNATLSKPVTEVYGSTETGGIAYRSVMDDAAPALWQPFPNVEVTVDPETQVLAVKSPCLPGKDWFLSGDRACLYADGRFALGGRADRVVKLEEQRVSLPEVERRLAECVEVDAARVISLSGETTKRQILAAVIEPSIAGWKILASEGRQNLRSLLRDALKPYLTAVVLPRKWRFVRRIPEDNRGKTSDAALAALFTDNQGRCVEPVIVRRESEQDSLLLHLQLREDLFYFEGHFDEAPILAGVVQIDWAIEFAIAQFAIPGVFRRIDKLKFFKVLKAGDAVMLDLRYDRETARLNFHYGNAETKYSSGCVIFEAMP
jgi:acyl-coenzyme A synthetase/AMP-(fatty) acid ligase/3-hydroxymyristoyl/3-hydroxydecanoyl-(acyl carrier protein) dehydratase